MARAHQVGQSVEWKFLTERKLQEVDRSVWRGHIVVVNCMPMSCIRRGEWARFRRPHPSHTKTARRFRAGLLLVAERAIEPNTLYAPLYNARRLILNAESSRKYYLIIAGNGVTLG